MQVISRSSSHMRLRPIESKTAYIGTPFSIYVTNKKKNLKYRDDRTGSLFDDDT